MRNWLSHYRNTAENGHRTSPCEGRLLLSLYVIGGERSIEAENKTRDLIIVDL